MLTIQLDSPVPIGDQIRLGLRRAIASGAVKPGDPLPTVRQLAADTGFVGCWGKPVDRHSLQRELAALGLAAAGA